MQILLIQPFCSYGCENSREGAELSRKSFTGFWGGTAALSLGGSRLALPAAHQCLQLLLVQSGPCCGSAPGFLCTLGWVRGSIPKDEAELHTWAHTRTHARHPQE